MQFSSYTTDELRQVAIDAIDGKFTANDLPAVPSGKYNSGAMLEMHANLSLTSSAEIDAKVKIASPGKPSYILRSTVPPDPQTVSNLVADLFLNQDTWAFDDGWRFDAAGRTVPNRRSRRVFRQETRPCRSAAQDGSRQSWRTSRMGEGQ